MDKSLPISNLLIAMGLNTAAFSLAAESDFFSWQFDQLFQPTPAQILQEKQGSIFIYDGLYDTDVERAMDVQFQRIEHMMFVRTIITDPAGKAKTDETTGDLLIEEDGCDD